MTTINPTSTKAIMFDNKARRYILAGESRTIHSDPALHRKLLPGQVAVSVFDNCSVGSGGEDHHKDYMVVTAAGQAGDHRTVTYWGRIGQKHQSKRIGYDSIRETFIKRLDHGYSYRGTVILTGAEMLQSLTRFLETGNYTMRKPVCRHYSYDRNGADKPVIINNTTPNPNIFVWTDDGEDAVL